MVIDTTKVSVKMSNMALYLFVPTNHSLSPLSPQTESTYSRVHPNSTQQPSNHDPIQQLKKTSFLLPFHHAMKSKKKIARRAATKPGP